MTMKPNEIAAIVLDVDPLKTRSCSTICRWKPERDNENVMNGKSKSFFADFVETRKGV
jgi:hypothetical protein